MTNRILPKIAFLATLFLSSAAFARPDSANDYLADPNGVADSTPNWNQAMADNIPCLNIVGMFRFCSQPNAVSNGMAIIGVSATSSQLVRSYDGGTFISIEGLSGGRISNLVIIADIGTTGGLGLNIVAGPLGAAATWDIEGITIQGWGNPFNTFSWPLHIWGGGGIAEVFGPKDGKTWTFVFTKDGVSCMKIGGTDWIVGPVRGQKT